jgi:oxygen-independent coproporphyrinogen-3 oxidase
MADVIQPDPSTTPTPVAGNYFVANYPPFSFWSPAHLEAARAALERPPVAGTPLGVYVHIPFCRKRCHFCYYKVYTDKNAAEIRTYLDAMGREIAMYTGRPFVGGRHPRFVYFGGGTPSYLSPE